MTKQLNKKIISVICIFFAFILTLGMSEEAYAGSINANEASVIAAAGSIFEYQGNRYIAAPGYIDRLSAKLSSDDTDLTAEQASSAIGAIYDNIPTGVDKGYLTLIGPAEPTPAPTVEPTPEVDKNEKKKEKDKKDKDKKDKDKDKKDKDKKDKKDDTSDVAEQPQYTEPPVVVIDPTREPNKTTDIKVEEEMKVIDNEVNQLDIQGSNYEFATSVPVTSAAATGDNKFDMDMVKATEALKLLEQTDPSDIIRSIKNDFVYPVALGAGIAAGLLFIALIIYIFLKKKKNFKKTLVSVAGILLMFAGVTAISVSAIGAYCFADSEVLINSIAREKYYNKVYKTLNNNVNDVLTSAGFEKDVLKELINERSVYLNGKLSLEATFDKGRRTDFLDVQNTVYEMLSHHIADQGYYYTEEVKANTTNISGLIQAIYRDSLKFTYADSLKKNIKSMQKNFLWIGIGGLILLIFGLLLLLFTQKYIHRITRLSGLSLIIPGICIGGSVGLYILQGKSKKLNLSPGDYKDFFSYYVKGASEFTLAVCAILVLVAAALIVITYLLKSTNKLNKFVIWRY